MDTYFIIMDTLYYSMDSNKDWWLHKTIRAQTKQFFRVLQNPTDFGRLVKKYTDLFTCIIEPLFQKWL